MIILFGKSIHCDVQTNEIFLRFIDTDSEKEEKGEALFDL